MTETPGTPPGDPSQPPPAYDAPPPGFPAPPGASGNSPPPPAAGYAAPPPGYAPAAPGGIGQVRGTGKCILLAIVTLGIYQYFWYYSVHSEMQRHKNGQGLGGGLAVVLTFFVGFVMPFITADEVGKLYEARGQQKPVSATTGLWYIPGFILLFIGPIVWFVKTNGALNEYWKSLGATG